MVGFPDGDGDEPEVGEHEALAPQGTGGLLLPGARGLARPAAAPRLCQPHGTASPTAWGKGKGTGAEPLKQLPHRVPMGERGLGCRGRFAGGGR